MGLGLVWDGKGKFVVGLSLRLVSSRSVLGKWWAQSWMRVAWRMGLQWVYDWFRMDLGLVTGGFRMGLG